jgi:ABC-type nitrate/sulfonate/bicarbonate transport system substrate-binding protein
MMRPLFVMVLVLMTVVALMSCSKHENVKQVRIGIIKPSIDHLPLSIALEKHYLDPAKLRVFSFTSGWELQEAITAGKLDLAIMPFTYAWTAISKGYKLKIVSCLERETDGIVALPAYKSLEALDNHKIGLLRASTLEILMQDTAQRNGIAYKPVYFRTPIEMIAALQAREVDAIVCYVPLIQKIDEEYQVLHWFSEAYPAHPCCDLVASEETLISQPGIINRIQDGISQAIKDINAPSEDVFRLVMQQYGLDSLQAADALKRTRFDNLLTEKDKQFELQMMQSFRSNGYLKQLPAIADVFVK